MKVYPIYPSLIDVFQGEGWENWSRLQYRRGTWRVVAGLPLSPAQIAEATRSL